MKGETRHPQQTVKWPVDPVASTKATAWTTWDGTCCCKVMSLLPWAPASFWEMTVEMKLVSTGIPNQSHLSVPYYVIIDAK